MVGKECFDDWFTCGPTDHKWTFFFLRTIWVVGVPYSSDRGEMELCREFVCNSRRILLLFLVASGNGGFPLVTVDGKP